MSLLVVGSVAFDSLETPFGKVNKTLGGSASYFSFASSRFAPTSVVAVVGDDFNEFAAFRKLDVDTSGILKAKGKTFHWAGKYSFDLNSRETLKTELGVFADFKPKLSDEQKKADYVFLGNIHPKLQLDVLEQIEKPKFVGLDTMNYWMESALPDLKKVLHKVDILIINDSEARELSGEHNLLKASKKILLLMGTTSPRNQSGASSNPSLKRRGIKQGPLKPFHPKTLIIKRGEYGLLMFQKDKIFNLPGYPLEDVVDPTGAGDTFAGGFFGHLAKTDDISWPNLKRACLYGSTMASFCVENMGTKKLTEIGKIEITKRLKNFENLIKT